MGLGFGTNWSREKNGIDHKAAEKATEDGVSKAMVTKGNDKPKSKTVGEGTGKVDTSKKRSKTGVGNEEEEKTGAKITSRKRKRRKKGMRTSPRTIKIRRRMNLEQMERVGVISVNQRLERQRIMTYRTL